MASDSPAAHLASNNAENEKSRLPLLGNNEGIEGEETEEQKKKREEKEAAANKRPIKDLFRYATGWDAVLLLIGTIVAVITGAGFPMFSILMGNLSDSFIKITMIKDGYNASAIAPIMSTTAASTVASSAMNGSDSGICNDTTAAGRHLDMGNYSEDKFSDEVIKYCIYYTLLGAAVFIAATIQVCCYLVACENQINKIRRKFFRAILHQDIAWFDKNQSGTLTTKLFDNLERIKEGIGDKVALMVQYTAQFLAGFVVAFTYNWKLTLIMLSLTPLMVFIGAFITKLMAGASAQEAATYAKAGGIAEEVLSSMRTVVSFNGQKRECDRYKVALDAGKKDGILKSFYIGLGLCFTMVIIFGSYGLAFWFGTVMVRDCELAGGTVLTVFFAVMLGSMALGQAGPQMAVIATAQGAAGAIFDIIDRKPAIDSYDESGLKPTDTKGHVEFQDVHFSYPTRPDVEVLKGVSFDVQPGETVALVGSSGCGKSTIVGLLLRYYDAESGKIMIDGNEVSKLNLHHLRNMIAVVSQEPILFDCTIEENIRFGRENVTQPEMMHACKMANAEKFISQLPKGYQTIVGERGTQLSGGQKQRIAIARALVRDPKILLLDEATSALDAESESIVQEALEKAAKGRTTIIIAHRLSTIRNADKIIAVKAGEIKEIGNHHDLMERHGLYYDLVNAQVFTDAIDDVEPGHEDEIVNERPPMDRQFSNMSGRSRLSSMSSVDGKVVPRARAQTLTNDPVPNAVAVSKVDQKNEQKRLKAELELEGAQKSNLFEILGQAKPEWGMIFVALIMCLIQGIVFPAFSLMFTQVLDTFSKHGPELEDGGRLWSLMFVALGLIDGFAMLGSAFLFGWAAERLTMRLRFLVFKNVLRQDIGYFDHPAHSSGKICTRLATDAPNIKSAIDYRLGSVVSAAVSISAGIGIAFFYGWKMALVVLVIFPLAGVAESLQVKFQEGRHREDAKMLEEAGKTATEAIENVRTVQALTREKRFFELFSGYLDQPFKTARQKAIIQGFSYGFANSVYYFLYAAAFRFGLYLILDNQMVPMDVMRVLFAISFTAGSLGWASAFFPEYIKARFAAGILFKMLREEPKIDSFSTAGMKPQIIGNLEFKDIQFSYPSRTTVRVLRGLNLKLETGRTLALVGPSGCGKSTVVSLMERFYDPLDGDITVDGKDLKAINPAFMRGHIALVSQEPVLFDCSIRENIIYGLDESTVSEDKINEAATLANIHKFISELPDGYKTRVGTKGTQLSGGQKQRIAIARALVRDPKILLLDEATSALDTESEKIVQEALDRAREGRTCIIIAHRLSTVINADSIAVIKNGIVVEQGTHAELVAQRGAYFSLTQKQNLHE
uniref:ABC-type xenobiotic transporter n=1 Tax=Plectus sambesii TaxID=2011161 RepID=A0A914WVT4_9BILA